VTVPGWYPDPDGSRRLRFWDGATWTDHTAVPADTPHVPSTASGPPTARPAGLSGPMSATTAPPPRWTPGTPPPAPPPRVTASPRPWDRALLPDIGAWLGATFRIVQARKRFVAAATAVALAPALLCAIALVIAASVSDATLQDSSESAFPPVEGDGLVVGLYSATTILAALSYFFVIGAVAHQVRGHMAGRDPSVGASLRWGARRMPRVVGWTVVVVLAAMGVGIVAILPAALSPALLILTLPAAAAVVIWVGVRLILYAVVAALAPGDRPVLRTAWDVAEERWWGLLGRWLLIGLIVGLAGFFVALPLSLAATANDSVVLWSVGQLVSTLANGIGATITAIGLVLIYAWIDGPVDPAVDA
jgi:hypothetical protein